MKFNSQVSNWNSLNWGKIDARVGRIQNRIYTASKAGQIGQVRFLQNVWIKRMHAKLIAVGRVTTESKRKTTPGLDEILYETPSENMQLCRRLRIDGRASPIRRVCIPKPGKPEKRPLGIATIKHRAKQKLVWLALEPEWEDKFEANSYGFRPGRSTKDAVEQILSTLRTKQKVGA